MADTSLYELARQIEKAIVGILSGIDLTDEEPRSRKLLAEIKHGMSDARLEVRDYEYADTHAEQQRAANKAKKRLLRLREHIADPHMQGVFSAVDVALISGQIDTLIAALD